MLKISINDAAAFLIQLDASDTAEVTRLYEMLNTLSQDETIPDSGRNKLHGAAQDLHSIQSGQASDPDELITRTGHILEEVMHEIDMLETMTPPNPQKAPAAQEIKSVESDEPIQKALEVKPNKSTQPAQPAQPAKSDKSHKSDKLHYFPDDAELDLIQAFIAESNDLIAKAEEALLELETDPENMDAVSIVFRAFHTVKGTSGFLKLDLLTEMAHHAENLLSRIRDKEIQYGGGYADLALRSIDMLKELIEIIQRAKAGDILPKPASYDELAEQLSSPEKFGISDESLDSPEYKPRIGDILVAQGKTTREKIEALASSEDETPIGERIIKSKAASVTDVAQGLRTQKKISSGGRQISDAFVRVSVDRLDRLIDMVGELVVSHSMVAQDDLVIKGDNHDLNKKVSQTTKIVRELQSIGMAMRMIPLKSTFQKMARLSRDLSRKVNKKVAFITDGEDTEIDRNMVDYINDPLVHMVRNAVDHGIEPPEVREKLGKPATGTVRIGAYHSAGNVVVEIEDDGKGLDPDKILKKAISQGIIKEEDVHKERQMTDREIFSLIFEPGFSTAENVSDVSGRGVGMDVVRKNIETLHGQVEIYSEVGKGSTFKMSFPLTLAIIDGMVVRVNREKYVIPTVSIVRSIQPEAKDITTVLKKGEMLIMQGQLLPLFRLDRLFDIDGAEQDLTKAIVVIVEDDGKQAGLLIDELIGSQQIVIKTLGEALGSISGISGSAIMPNGRVGLILDVGGLVKLANEFDDR